MDTKCPWITLAFVWFCSPFHIGRSRGRPRRRPPPSPSLVIRSQHRRHDNDDNNDSGNSGDGGGEGDDDRGDDVDIAMEIADAIRSSIRFSFPPSSSIAPSPLVDVILPQHGLLPTSTSSRCSVHIYIHSNTVKPSPIDAK